MTKFFGNGLVWDKEKDSLLCTFVNGEFITEDKRIIDILTNLKYQFEVEAEIEHKFISELKQEILLETKIDEELPKIPKRKR